MRKISHINICKQATSSVRARSVCKAALVCEAYKWIKVVLVRRCYVCVQNATHSLQ